MMTVTVVIAQLIAADKESRKTIIGALKKTGEHSRRREPEVTRYAICLPRDESDEKSVWVIEEYASQAGFDAHMGSQAVKDLIAFFGANATLFGGAPDISTSEVNSTFTRPETTKADNPWICYASIEYKEGKRSEALEGWKHVTAETEKNEPETLSYSNYKNRDHPETVKTMEVYTSQQYFKDVHVPSKAVQGNLQKHGNDIRVSLKHVSLKLIGGYLAKEKSMSNL
ncbi:hypothetical protein P280DRAFT_446753 [Massarina eburnea CBS 473.64]|uniref:ABM domain-containing protein n=1 Tax=Massarina eburnea CBS 473.64 TaxID=1395130 RepID=A0A6A6S8K3_9PLEO|nr:hypothetical protein P280DRAFT_446753 [Massarina eburnea CBS 473.64]